MAGPAIIMFSQAQRLVYRRAVGCRPMVWGFPLLALGPTAAILMPSPRGPLPGCLEERLLGCKPFTRVHSQLPVHASSPPHLPRPKKASTAPAGPLHWKALGDQRQDIWVVERTPLFTHCGTLAGFFPVTSSIFPF